MTETASSQGEIRIISESAIDTNPEQPYAKIHKAFDFAQVPDGQTFIFVGSETRFDIVKAKGYVPVSQKTDGDKFYGADNLANQPSNSADGLVLDEAYLSETDKGNLDDFFDAAKGVLKNGGIVKVENLDLFFKDNSPKGRTDLAQGITEKGFNVYLMSDTSANSGPHDNGLMQQNFTLYAQKI